jgi:hypothetical protein
MAISGGIRGWTLACLAASAIGGVSATAHA